MEFVFNPENVLVWLKALLIKLYSAPNAQWNTKKYSMWTSVLFSV